ncbi:lycopene cyclase domain-containing protein [Isoptericola sp. F-RaC21]|uniref:lycopene cyclase domain-containing protein n=1 Tax=Isoptericola sp. F-RaC21 TaxID=3141452 RepID=UPI00315B4342
MTYAGLAAVVVAGALVLTLVVARVRRLGPRWWAATATAAVVLMVLTVVFDSLMIAADLFRYDEAALLGVRVWLTPVEDLAWPLVAALLLPALWALVAGDEAGAQETGA